MCCLARNLATLRWRALAYHRNVAAPLYKNLARCAQFWCGGRCIFGKLEMNYWKNAPDPDLKYEKYVYAYEL